MAPTTLVIQSLDSSSLTMAARNPAGQSSNSSSLSPPSLPPGHRATRIPGMLPRADVSMPTDRTKAQQRRGRGPWPAREPARMPRCSEEGGQPPHGHASYLSTPRTCLALKGHLRLVLARTATCAAVDLDEALPRTPALAPPPLLRKYGQRPLRIRRVDP